MRVASYPDLFDLPDATTSQAAPSRAGSNDVETDVDFDPETDPAGGHSTDSAIPDSLVTPATTRQAALAQLMQAQPALWRGRDLAQVARAGCPTGFAALDAVLPGAGWPAGVLTELLSPREGMGEMQLLMPALARLAREGRRLVCIAPPHRLHAPALVQAGIDPAAILVVEPANRRDLLWAAEQALRAATAAAVLIWPCAVPKPRALQYPELRRLQIAAEGGPALAFVFRPMADATAATCAALRIAIADPGRESFAVHILKRRGGLAGTAGLPGSEPLILDLDRGLPRKESITDDLAGHPLVAPPGRFDRRGEFIT